ncbi:MULTISPECIES: hypothetical protein [Brachybacterium]|uniref:ABC transporter permease n=1 Tax=Brachybacterium tyrofermentans TaxID=47848 RepID=A0ABW0FC93_9MICO|nr:hypothetical protein [Brachybacterium tyrofermentans]
MNRALSAVRVLGLAWLIPLQVVAIAVYRSGTFSVEEGYSPAEQALGSESFILCIPLVALAAAIAANKLDRSGFLDRPLARPPLLTLGMPLLGIFVPSAVMAVAAQAFSLRNASDVSVSFILLLTPVLWAGASTLFGWLVGAKLPLKFAAPLSVLVPYAIVGFPPAMDPAWMQHTIGMSTLCCGVSEVPSWRPLLAAFLLAGGASLAMWVAITRRLTRSIAAIAITGIIIPALMAGFSAIVAMPLGYQATSPRDGNLLSCKDFGVEVCYWPEHAFEVESSEPEIRAVIEVARTNGLLVPDRLVELPEDKAQWPAAPLLIRENDSPVEVQRKVAWAMMPIPSVECQEKMASSGMGESSLTYVAGSEVLAVWLGEAVGNPLPSDIISPDVPDIVDGISGDTDGGAGRLREAQELVTSCSVDRAVL